MDQPPVHRDRRRAESFGAVAERYDRVRPRYPAELIAGLVTRPGIRVLDVGAGTGIASTQLMEAGAEVLAVEPDPEMAHVAATKGIRVEVATFEQWEPEHRTFELVVFAQSFHWVEPKAALRRVGRLLDAGGHVALLWNRITPVTPTRQQFDEAYAGLLEQWQRPSVDSEGGDQLTALLDEAGFTSVQRHYPERLHYRTEEWVDMVTTYSNVLTLEPAAQLELRDRLERCIGADGVEATNDALAVVCTLAR